MDIIHEEMKTCININENIKKDRISEIIDYAIKSMPFKFETSEYIINNHIDLLVYFDEPHTLDDYIIELKNITSEKIKTTLAKYFKEENFASAVLMPQGLRR